ncbi:uncharacterized protein LACBIDRAFT_328264 [Laccaria bicolor S238N-H82]|uniref:Predicted protein n=1 Tax=Laccaria bicolor (strain S238N-H82 / ATCC MYA-4686) TaxID=486041 RepID=B0DEC7_LACBS|nr:uncharacterized protein LACBIDRAFT_328264 [Laccaria bicolor S238N-H82]EDR07013.1 predicted protein [Laccaria bicolor S238N-H82]|eukprot:XP_001882386.1 predicted protein [Laccaria bicolor S238N-H82]
MAIDTYFPHLKTCITTSRLCTTPTPCALALAAKRVGHASCQFDGAPPLRPATIPPPSHISPPSAAHAGEQGGQQAAQQVQQPVGDKHVLLANEKRRRRRGRHNAAGRRRRDNIDEKIGELATLIWETHTSKNVDVFSTHYLIPCQYPMNFKLLPPTITEKLASYTPLPDYVTTMVHFGETGFCATESSMFVADDNVDGLKACSQAKRGCGCLKFIMVRDPCQPLLNSRSFTRLRLEATLLGRINPCKTTSNRMQLPSPLSDAEPTNSVIHVSSPYGISATSSRLRWDRGSGYSTYQRSNWYVLLSGMGSFASLDIALDVAASSAHIGRMKTTSLSPDIVHLVYMYCQYRALGHSTYTRSSLLLFTTLLLRSL